MMMTKTRFLVGILLLFMRISLYAQTTKSSEEAAEGFDYGSELSQMVNIPNSPEAAAFMQYGDTQVNLHSGTPNISVPLHVIQGRELNLPITLTYDATAIGVKQLASWVGLSWNLNVGGRISRIKNGLADDYIQGNQKTIHDNEVVDGIKSYSSNSTSFNTPAAVQDYFDFLFGINQGSIDAQPDYFSLNVMGLNAMIVYDYTSRQYKALDNKKIKIVASGSSSSISSWYIVGEDGTQYFFDTYETTWHDGNDQSPSLGSIFHEYNSSWVLTKIISPNGKDTYEFTYTNFGYWDQENPGHAASHVVNTLSTSTSYPSPDSQTRYTPNYKIKQQFLTKIIHNENTVVENILGNRSDIDINSALEEMIIYDPHGDLLKNIVLDYSYFNENQMSGEYSIFDIRLKLDQVHLQGSDSQTYQTYSFEYNRPNELPSRSDKGMDYLGYYNGAGNNELYPAVSLDDRNFSGADRNPNSTYAQIGLLDKISYPTGGYTIFTYEGNSILEDQQITREVVDVSDGLNASSTITPELYRDDDGNYCDDM